MSEFQEAVDKVLAHEGGLVDNSSDPGGLTNFGIALNKHPELTVDDVRNMTKAQASDIYQKQYWASYMETEPDQRVGNCALDCAVNQGPAVAKQLYLQFGHSLKEFQLARLLRYAALNRPAFNHSWFERVLDV